MIKRRSPQNIVLYTYILSDVVDFLQRAHSMGILRPSVKLVLIALVSTLFLPVKSFTVLPMFFVFLFTILQFFANLDI